MSGRPIIVVGAGPAGSGTAIHLARRGLAPLLLDARVFPRSKPCGDAVSPGATPLLRELGVWDELCAGRPGTIDGWRIRSPGGRWFGGIYREDRPPSPPAGVAIDRRVLDATLLAAARAAGVEVREARRVFELVWRGDRVCGVRARGPDGEPETYRARMVVGADGLRSRVARLLGPVRTGPVPKLAIVARLEGVGAAGTHGELRLSREGVLGSAPIGPDRANVTLVIPRSAARRLAPAPEGFLRAGIARYGLARRLGDARLVRPVDVTGPFEAAPGRRTAPGALLVGDAAGYFDPLTGQGVYAALRGAELAAETVVGALERPATEEARLGEYERALDRLLGPTRRVQRLVDGAVRRPWLIEPVAALLAARPGLAGLLLEVTGDRLPPAALLHPGEWLGALGSRPVVHARGWGRHAHT